MWGISVATAVLAGHVSGAGVLLVADLRTGGRFADAWGGGAGRAAPPASVFKTASALVLARSGRTGRSLCRRGCSLRSGHGAVSLRAAFAHSCNNYFVAKAPERSELLAAGLELGLVRAADLPALRRSPHDELVLGLAPELALTPAELLEAVVRWPRLEAWGALKPLLAACGAEGTCREAHAGGKTGTAPAPDGSGKTAGWFVGFAPLEDPQVAVVVFLDRATGRQAAAAAGEALAWYFQRSSSR
ncbi:MAG: hypothetical protein HY928_15795 [Elusimicrobia bacterium]|nr:hypothetical protein [Elusimicrobiota bacterium]